MPVLRKCNKCGESAMEPVSRKMQPYNSVYNYKCTNCGAEVELIPAASLGVQITIGLLFAAVIWAIFFGKSAPDTFDLIIYLAVMAILPGMALVQLLKYRANPAVESDTARIHMEIEETRNITKKPVLWIEKLNFYLGLLAPVLLVVVVLGIASIIGFINFTYFGN